MDQVDSWEGTYERSGGTRVQFSWSLVPLKSAALQWLALQSSFYYLIVLERALPPSSSSWSIEFLNFLHKSSSSRSNLRTSPTQNLQQKTLQLFVAHFLFKHWIASNDFIVWADHTISLFGELLIWAPFSSHPWRPTCVGFGHEKLRSDESPNVFGDVSVRGGWVDGKSARLTVLQQDNCKEAWIELCNWAAISCLLPHNKPQLVAETKTMSLSNLRRLTRKSG